MKTELVGIVDYGMGNISSIQNMIRYVGGTAEIISTPDDLRRADRIVLPGVGAFDNGMKKLAERGFIEVLNMLVLEEKRPVLGICLGMQLMTRSSEEGNLPGLGWVNADTRRIQDSFQGNRIRVPHMGWNSVTFIKDSQLSAGLGEDARFYFVHAFVVQCHEQSDVLCECVYGHTLTAGVQRQHIQGVQFHPEKSHKFGMTLLRNFTCPAN